MRRASHERIRTVAIAWIATLALLATPAPSDALEAAEASAPEASAAATGASSRALEETWYARSRVESEFGEIMTHYWSKGALFRAETVVAGHPITTIVNGDRYYIFDSALADGAALERNSLSIEEDATRGRPFARELQELLEDGAEMVREGSLDEGSFGYEVYQLTNEVGRRRVLVTKSAPQLPIKIETFVRETGSTGVLEYAGWRRGFELSDSFFEPPNTVLFEKISYREYTSRFGKVPIGPAPVYYRHLLHGSRKLDR